MKSSRFAWYNHIGYVYPHKENDDDMPERRNTFMKRLPIIVLTLALCLLTAGCGAKPNEPDDGDSAKAGIVERMATVKAEEIKYT